MGHVYKITTGAWTGPDGVLIDLGYSGRLEGLNNPQMQDVKFIGPLPVGFYSIGPAHDGGHLGPVCMELKPFEQNEMYTRGDFLVHADEKKHPGEHLASDGCIILGHDARVKISLSLNRLLQVIE